MRFIITGPPASGKGSVAPLLQKNIMFCISLPDKCLGKKSKKVQH